MPERSNREISDDDISEAIRMCREFLQKKHELVELETSRWAEEFQKQLSNIDKLSPNGRNHGS